MTSNEVALIVLPVFCVLGLGYVSVWTGYLSEKVGEAIGQFVYNVAIPLMLFRSLGSAEFPDAPPWPLYIAYFSGIAVVWLLSGAAVRLLFHRGTRGGVIAGFSATYSNLVMVGIPLALTAYGDKGMVPLLLIISIHLPIMTVVSTILIAYADHADGGSALDIPALVRRVVVTLLTNPIVIGLAAGAIWRMTGWELHTVAAQVVDRMGAAAITCALFSMGMALRQYGLRGNLGPGLLITALKLGVQPALVFVIATYLLTMPPVWAAVAVISAALPTGVNAYLIATHFNTGHGIAANSITISTMAAIVTLGLWLSFLGPV